MRKLILAVMLALAPMTFAQEIQKDEWTFIREFRLNAQEATVKFYYRTSDKNTGQGWIWVHVAGDNGKQVQSWIHLIWDCDQKMVYVDKAAVEDEFGNRRRGTRREFPHLLQWRDATGDDYKDGLAIFCPVDKK